MFIDETDGRYSVFEVTRIDGSKPLLSYGVSDHAYVPSEPIMDWRRKHRVPWYGTLADALDLRDRLNRERTVLGQKKPKTEYDITSKSQRIMYANKARKKSVSQQKQPVRFRACPKCGRMTRLSEHC